MTVVKLKILEPQHGATFTQKRAVTLRGEVEPGEHTTLFYKWYSNVGSDPPLPEPTDKNPDTSLNRGNTAALTFVATLPLGTHVITLAARDVAGETKADLEKVKHAGMAGGPATGPAPCVVHVMYAEITEPAENAALGKSAAGPKFAARVPPVWENKEYQTNVNQLRYVFRLVPEGLPAGRGEATLEPAFGPHPDPTLKHMLKLKPPFEFVKAGSMMRYAGPLPAGLGTGSYSLRLRVERRDNPSVAHEASLRVLINP
jgi:hypothetical protein